MIRFLNSHNFILSVTGSQKSLETALEVNILLRKFSWTLIAQTIIRMWEKMKSNEKFYLKVKVLAV